MRDVLYQRVFEAVTNLRGYATPEHDLGLQQLVEITLKSVFIKPRDHFQEVVSELAPDAGCDLGDFLDRGQPVKAGHERVLERRWDRQRRQGTRQLVMTASVLEQAGFEHRFSEFFDEQRHAIGLCQNLLKDFLRKLLAAGYPVDHGSALPASQPAQKERCHVPVPRPAGNELRPEGDNHEHREPLYLVDSSAEQFEGGRIGPVDVLVDGEHRLPCRQAFDLLQKSLKRSLLLLVRAELQWPVSLARWDRQQVRDKRRALLYVVGPQSEHRFELVELLCGRILAPNSRCPFKEPNDRVQRAVGVER